MGTFLAKPFKVDMLIESVQGARTAFSLSRYSKGLHLNH